MAKRRIRITDPLRRTKGKKRKQATEDHSETKETRRLNNSNYEVSSTKKDVRGDIFYDFPKDDGCVRVPQHCQLCCMF